MNFIVPTFKTTRLILRELQTGDIPSYERYFVNYKIISQLSSSVPWPYPQGGVAYYLESAIKPEQGQSRWDLTEAVAPIHDYAFDVLRFDQLILSNALGNIKSRRIKEKTGAVFLGTRSAKFVDSAYTEAETWELTPGAWIEFKKATAQSK